MGYKRCGVDYIEPRILIDDIKRAPVGSGMARFSKAGERDEILTSSSQKCAKNGLDVGEDAGDRGD